MLFVECPRRVLDEALLPPLWERRRIPHVSLDLPHNVPEDSGQKNVGVLDHARAEGDDFAPGMGGDEGAVQRFTGVLRTLRVVPPGRPGPLLTDHDGSRGRGRLIHHEDPSLFRGPSSPLLLFFFRGHGLLLPWRRRAVLPGRRAVLRAVLHL